MRFVSSFRVLPLIASLSFGVITPSRAEPLTLPMGVIQVVGKPYPAFAFKSWKAEQLLAQTELIKANPGDAQAYARRAALWQWVAINKKTLPALHDINETKAELMNADIHKAIELAPKDPQVYLFVARAVDTDEQRERALQMSLDLGSVEAAEELAGFYVRAIFLNPKSESASRKISQLQILGKTVTAKFTTRNAFVALCVAGAFQALSEVTPDKKAMLDVEANRRITALAQSEPQKTYDAISQIARWMQQNLLDNLAQKWAETAAAIPNIKESGTNFFVRARIARAAGDETLAERLMKRSVSTFRADAPDASDAAVALYEMQAKAGDLGHAQSSLERALYAGADPRYWLQVGDLAFATGDFKQAVAAYQTADELGIGNSANHALRLEIALAQSLAGDLDSAATQYEKNIYGYDNPYLIAHQKLLESQLQKTPDNAVLKTALGNIKDRINSPDTKPKQWETVGDDKKWSERPYAPKP